jgi:hypothetical protein
METLRWFQNSDAEIRHELGTLPDGSDRFNKANFDGFLNDLAQRPEFLGGVTVTRLLRLPRGNFSITPVFEVVNEQGRQFTYEYVSWRHGPMSGAKGVVFVADKGEITHFIHLTGEKFSTGMLEDDCPGGFGPEGLALPLRERVGTGGFLSATMQKELLEELEVKELKILSAIPLGTLKPDIGMTCNAPEIFAVVIDFSDCARLGRADEAIDTLELRQGINIKPIQQLPKFTQETESGFFSSIVGKIYSKVFETELPLKEGLKKVLLHRDYLINHEISSVHDSTETSA